MAEQMPKLFSEDIKIDDEVIGRVNGWFTKDGIICLQSLTIFSPEINHIKIINVEGAMMANITVRVGIDKQWDTLYFNGIPMVSPKFIIEVMKSDNKKVILEVDKRGEVLKEVIKSVIKDIADKKPVVVIEQKE